MIAANLARKQKKGFLAGGRSDKLSDLVNNKGGRCSSFAMQIYIDSGLLNLIYDELWRSHSQYGCVEPHILHALEQVLSRNGIFTGMQSIDHSFLSSTPNGGFYLKQQESGYF